MLKVYRAENQKSLDDFISIRMDNLHDWAFVQPDCSKAVFPAQFVVVTETDIKLATIQLLY